MGRKITKTGITDIAVSDGGAMLFFVCKEDMSMKRMPALLLAVVFCLSLFLPVAAETLYFPENLKRIGEEAFYGDMSLDEVVIPEGVEIIGDRAFADSSLSIISLPESLKGIGINAFPNGIKINAPADSRAYTWASIQGYEVEDPTIKDTISSDAIVYNGHAYKIYDSYYSWNKAKRECEKNGGHLITVTSQEEYDFLVSFVNNYGARRLYWIGLSCESNGSEWKWVTDEKNSYHPELSIDYWGAAPYVCAYFKDDGTWMDLQTDVTGPSSSFIMPWDLQENFGYICEWDRDDVPEPEETQSTFDLGELVDTLDDDNSLFIDTLEAKSTEGVTDPEELNEIEKYNARVSSLNDNITRYNNSLSSLIDEINSISTDLNVTDDSIAVSFNDIVFSISNNAIAILSNDYSYVGSEDYGNGITKITVEQNGENKALYHSGMAVSDNPDSLPGEDNNTNQLEQIQDMLETIGNKAEEVSDALSFMEMGALLSDDDELKAKIGVVGDFLETLSIPSTSKKLAELKIIYDELKMMENHMHPSYMEGCFEVSKFCAAKLYENLRLAKVFLKCDATINGINLFCALKNVVAKDLEKTAKDELKDQLREKISDYIKNGEDNNNDDIQEMINSLFSLQKYYNECIKYDRMLHYDVYGYVKDKNGHFLSNVAVKCGEATFYTNEVGYYEIEIPGPSCTLTFSKDGYYDASKTASAPPYCSMPVPLVELEELPKAIVSGEVKDEFGALLEMVAVETRYGTAYTGSDGKYSIEMTVGDTWMKFSKSGYVTEPKNITVSENGDNKYNAALDWKYGLVGTVTSDEGPVEGASFTAGHKTWYTDSSGTFRAKIDPGDYEIRISATGYMNQNLTSATAEKDVTVREDGITNTSIQMKKLKQYYRWWELGINQSLYPNRVPCFTGTISWSGHTVVSDRGSAQNIVITSDSPTVTVTVSGQLEDASDGTYLEPVYAEFEYDLNP